jgi:hypothetical protein
MPANSPREREYESISECNHSPSQSDFCCSYVDTLCYQPSPDCRIGLNPRLDAASRGELPWRMFSNLLCAPKSLAPFNRSTARLPNFRTRGSQFQALALPLRRLQTQSAALINQRARPRPHSRGVHSWILSRLPQPGLASVFNKASTIFGQAGFSTYDILVLLQASSRHGVGVLMTSFCCSISRLPRVTVFSCSMLDKLGCYVTRGL